jgi:hypothetical protein
MIDMAYSILRDLINYYPVIYNLPQYHNIFLLRIWRNYEYGAIPLFSSAVKTKFNLTGSKPAPGAGKPYILM